LRFVICTECSIIGLDLALDNGNHFSQFSSTPAGGCTTVRKSTAMFEHLKSVAKSMHQAQETVAAFLASNEGERMLELALLQSSPLVVLLREVAAQKARPDG
jgi:hypothetical protein